MSIVGKLKLRGSHPWEEKLKYTEIVGEWEGYKYRVFQKVARGSARRNSDVWLWKRRFHRSRCVKNKCSRDG